MASPLTGPITRGALRLKNDRELLRLVREGYDQAFEAIVDRYHDELLRYSAGFVGHDRGQDVVQQVFVKVLERNAPDRDDAGIENLRGWLYRVAHNGAINMIKAKASDWSELDERGTSGASTAQTAEQRDRIRRAIDELGAMPARERTALVMTQLGDSDLDEVAREVGATRVGARQLAYRARKRLRETCGLLVPAPVLRWLMERDGATISGTQAAELAGGGGAGIGLLLKSGAAVVAVLTPIAGAGLLVDSGRPPAGELPKVAIATDAPGKAPAKSTGAVKRYRPHRKHEDRSPPRDRDDSTPPPVAAPKHDAQQRPHDNDDAVDPSASPARGSNGPGAWSANTVGLEGWGAASGELEVDNSQNGDLVAGWLTPTNQVRVAYGAADRGFLVEGLSEAGPVAADPQVTATERGHALVAWHETITTDGAPSRSIRFTERSPGGEFGWPHTLATVAAGATPDDLELAISERGDVLAAWLERVGSGAGANEVSTLRVALRPAGGKFTTKTLSEPGAITSSRAIALAPTGGGLIAWSSKLPGRAEKVELATLGGDTGAIGPPVKLSGIDPAVDPAVAIDSGGGATLAWTERPPKQNAEVVGATLAADGTIDFAGRISSPSLQASAAQAASAPNGGTALVWQGRDRASGNYRAQATVLERGGKLKEGVTITDLGVAPLEVDLAADAQGNWQVVWGTANAMRGAVRSSYRPAGGKFQRFETLASGVGVGAPQLSLDGQGSTVAIWRAGEHLAARYR